MKINKFDPEQYRLIVTSGGTREWIDPVRFISNPSTGKMGFFLAKEGLNYFKEVIYIAGNTEKEYRIVKNAINYHTDTTNEMAQKVFSLLKDYTILIMSAAPADYTPVLASNEKIKKQNQEITLQLKPTIDILKTIGNQYHSKFKNIILIGFAAETQNLESYIKEKMNSKNCHFICGNIVYKNQKGFGDNQNQIYIFDKWNEMKSFGPLPKEEIAKEILKYLILRISDVYDKI